MSNQELIVIKQLPIIEEQLKEMSAEIDVKVAEAKKLVCTEDNVKAIKQVRADLNREFKEIETRRKQVKEQVLAPYMQFEEVYKQYISDKFKSADLDLKNKIDDVEKELKEQKENTIRDYFEEYKTSKNIEFIKYEQARINVTLTASKKSLQEQCRTFIDKIVDDLNLIDTQEHRDEILVEYKQTLNVSQAITTVTNRFKAIEDERKKQEEIKQKQLEEARKIAEENIKNQTQATKQALDNFVIEKPVEVKQEEKLVLRFKVRGTKAQLKSLKEFLINGGYEYE